LSGIVLALSLPLFLDTLYTIAIEPGGRRAGRLPALELCLVSVLPAAWLAKSTHSAIEAIPAPKRHDQPAADHQDDGPAELLCAAVASKNGPPDLARTAAAARASC